MTISEMHLIVEQECFHIDGLHSAWVDIVLNSSIEQFVRDKFTLKGNDKLEGLDDSSMRSSDLQTLITTKSYTTVQPNPSIVNNSCDLPTDYLYPVSMMANINYTLTNRAATSSDPTKDIPVRFVDNEKIYHLMRNPHKINPEFGIIANISGGKIYFLPDKRSIIVSSNLIYLRKPEIVSLSLQQNCDLPEHTHNEIVQIAIAKLLEKSESPRFQTKLLDNKMID